MIGTIVWCAMNISGVNVYAEGTILVNGANYYSIRFNRQILAVPKEECVKTKPKNASLVPLVRRK